MDLNQGGEVDLHEFLAATLSRNNGLLTTTSPSLGAAFSLLDRDGDGFLTQDDLVALLGSNSTDFPKVKGGCMRGGGEEGARSCVMGKG